MAIDKLDKVSLVFLKKDTLSLLQELQHAHILHPTDSKYPELIRDTHSIKELDLVAHALMKMKWIKTHMCLKPHKHVHHYKHEDLYAILETCDSLYVELHNPLQDLTKQKESLQKEIEQYQKSLDIFKKIPFEINHMAYEGIHIFYTLFTYDTKESISKKYMHDIAKKHNATVMLNNEFGLLIGLQKEKEILISTLKKQGVSFISPVETIQSIHEDKHILPRLIEEKKHAIKTCLYEIHTLQVKYEKKLHKVITELEVYHTRFNIASKIAVTKYTCVLEGYVSQKDYGTLRDILIKYNGTLSALSTTKGPTKLSNLKYIRSYEIITKMFGLPKTTKTDPTIIMAFFIPFFFGLMFSDVGYGFLVSATSAILLRKGKMKRNSGMYDAGVILGACSLSTIFFGFLFGSFFGTLVPLTPLLFDPFVNAQYLLLVALGIGIIHLNLAHCIGVYEYIKERDYKTLLENTGSFVTLELGLLLLFFHRQIAYILLATSVGLFIKKSSLQGLLDITGVFGTWFSYARILALSLATGGIALGINIMAREIGSLGIFGLIMSTLLLLFGHAFNYILNILGCTIHSVRLHFVEFFSQYYEPGGIEFKPYGFKDK